MLTSLNMSELAKRVNIDSKNLMVAHTKSRREKKVAHHCTDEVIKYSLLTL